MPCVMYVNKQSHGGGFATFATIDRGPKQAHHGHAKPGGRKSTE